MSLPGSSRLWRGTAIPIAGLLSLVSVAAVYSLVSVWSGITTGHTQAMWNETFGTLEEVRERHPDREANAAALRLEELTAAVGIDTATRGHEGRARPAKGAHPEYPTFRKDLGHWRQRQIERAHREITPAPPSVLAYFERHAAGFTAIRNHLNAGEVPRWEMQVGRLDAAPLPNLLGHTQLQRALIGQVLLHEQAGRHDEAAAWLDASWQLSLSIRDNPILIAQLIAIHDARLQVGVLRQMTHPPDHWEDRLVEHDYRASFLTGLSFDLWSMAQMPFDFTSGDRRVMDRVSGVLARPYVRLCVADVSDRLHRRMFNLSRVEVLCDSDLSTRGADFDVEVPRWNRYGKLIVPNLNASIQQLARLELDLELTARLLELGRARRDNGGRWPAELPGPERSMACPDDRWLYEVDGAGEMSIALSREIEWPDARRALPTRFSTAP